MAFSRASFESLVFLILSSISASSSRPSSSPELLLDRLHLLVEVVLALRLLHLPLDAGADALLDLQHGDFALHQAEHLLQPLGDGRGLQDLLLVRNLDGEMRGHGVRELGVVGDLLDDADDLGRDLLVELHVALELGDDRAGKRLRFDLLAERVFEHHRIGLEIVGAVGVTEHLGALRAFDQHLDGAVGQLEQLQHARERPELEDRRRRRIIVRGVLLRGQQNERVGAHHLFERLDRLLAPDEQRHDHVREYDDVAQRQHRIGPGFARGQGGRGFAMVIARPPRFVVPLARNPRSRCCRECRWPGRGTRPVLAAPEGWVRDPAREISDLPYAVSFAPLLGGERSLQCQASLQVSSKYGSTPGSQGAIVANLRRRSVLGESPTQALAPASPARSA